MIIKSDIFPSSNNVMSLGSPNKKWLLNGKNVKDILEIEVTLSSSDGETKTVSNSAITAKHVVLEDVVENKIGYIIGESILEVPVGDIQWITGDGYITISCNMIDTSEITTETIQPAVVKLRLGVIE